MSEPRHYPTTLEEYAAAAPATLPAFGIQVALFHRLHERFGIVTQPDRPNTEQSAALAYLLHLGLDAYEARHGRAVDEIAETLKQPSEVSA